MSSIDGETSTPPVENASTTTPTPENPLLRASNPLVTDLEQEVLDEYTRLLGNVNKVCLPPLSPLYFPSLCQRIQLTNVL